MPLTVEDIINQVVEVHATYIARIPEEPKTAEDMQNIGAAEVLMEMFYWLQEEYDKEE